MLNINDDILMNRVGDYSSYIKGKQYYNEGRITELRTNKNHDYFRGTVRGSSNYQVSIRFNEKGDLISSHCTCPAYNEYAGGCKHIVAILFYIRKLILLGRLDQSNEEEGVRNIIDSYRYQIEEEKIPVNVEFNYEFNFKRYLSIDESSYLRLRIGEDKLYVVKSMKSFFESLENDEEIEFGKYFTFSPHVHVFKKEDKEVIDFLKLLYEGYITNHSHHHGYGGSGIYRDRKMLLTPIALKRFFTLMEGKDFNACIMNQKYENVNIVNENIYLNMKIQEHEKDLIINIDTDQDIVPLTADGEYFFSGNQIYRLSGNHKKRIIPLYEEIISKRAGILKVPNEYKESFISEVLPNIKNIVNLAIDEKVKESIYNPDLKVEIYFDKVDNSIVGKVNFVYGDIKINPFSSKDNSSNNITRILLRDIEKERYIFNLLDKGDFRVRDGEIYIEEEDKTFDFIYNIIPELQKDCDIYYSESFRNFKIRDSSYFSGSMRLNDDLNMLEFNFDIEGIDTTELDEVFKAMKEKRKYYKLKDGSFLPLDNRELEDMENIAEYINAGSIPKFMAMYLDEYLKERNLNFIKKNVNFKKLIQDINEPEDIEYETPKEVEGILRDYQKFGFKWLKTLSKYGLGGILADDMGLGKTLQIITLLLSEKDEKGRMPSLVVVPKSLVYNWETEIRKFAPNLKTLIVVGSKPDRNRLVKEINDYDVVITSYPLIRNDVELYTDFKFRFCILDEAQHIKNHSSLNSRSVKKIKAANYFALTGTPMENSLIELWSIFDFLMPGYLLSYRKFVDKYEKPIYREQDSQALKDLNSHIRPFILRRLKKEVLKELPDKIEQKIVVEMNKEQKIMYLAYLKATKGEIEDEISYNGFNKSHMKILAGLTRLRQICCHPSLFSEGYNGGSGKLDILKDILKNSIDNGHRILLFSQFTSMLSIIRQMLDNNGIKYMYLDGSTGIKERGKLVKEFNSGVGNIFLISLKAGGTGLNLTGADMVIHYDPWWNPAVEEQATDRAYRIGQENTVQVIKLITKGTIEEKIFKLQEDKKEMIDKVITEGETLVSKLSEEELLSLFE